VLGREGELEAYPVGGEPCIRLLEMWAEYLSRIRRIACASIGGVDQLRKSMNSRLRWAVLDQGMDFAGDENRSRPAS